ncbi:MAG: MFS transporter [Geminicoccaceae bacterium]|nr:MAG: MFS transporter [Geminicoccaceae bacterium]
MLQTVFSSWPLFLGLLLLMLGNGLQGTLLGLRADIEGFPTAITGLVMSIFYAGYLIGALRAPILIARVGHIRVFAAFSALASAAVLLHAIFLAPWMWAIMRLVSGFSFATLFIVAESWLNGQTKNADRAKVLGFYMFVVFGGMGAGQLLLGIADPADFVLFTAVSVLVSVAVVPMLLTSGPAPAIPTPKPIDLKGLFRTSPLGVVGTFASGLTGGAVFGMGAVFASQLGLAVGAVALFMFALMMAAMCGQFPLGYLADRFDRRLVIIIAALAAGAAGLGAVVVDGPAKLGLLTVAVFIAFPLYSVSVAHINDHLDNDGMTAAAGGIMMMNGFGAAVGPFAVGVAMSVLGPTGFALFIGGVYAALGGFGVYRTFRRPSVPLDEQGPTLPIPRATPAATGMAQEVALERAETDASAGEPGGAETAAKAVDEKPSLV